VPLVAIAKDYVYAAHFAAWNTTNALSSEEAILDARLYPTRRLLFRAELASLLRDVVGNPFRRVAVDPSCLTPTVLTLAQTAYDERRLPSGYLDPARLAVQSDAFEEAGCTDDAILSHLRSPGPHVRGCWALDLLLGKE
jgi:hypothetical protein